MFAFCESKKSIKRLWCILICTIFLRLASHGENQLFTSTNNLILMLLYD